MNSNHHNLSSSYVEIIQRTICALLDLDQVISFDLAGLFNATDTICKSALIKFNPSEHNDGQLVAMGAESFADIVKIHDLPLIMTLYRHAIAHGSLLKKENVVFCDPEIAINLNSVACEIGVGLDELKSALNRIEKTTFTLDSCSFLPDSSGKKRPSTLTMNHQLFKIVSKKHDPSVVYVLKWSPELLRELWNIQLGLNYNTSLNTMLSKPSF